MQSVRPPRRARTTSELRNHDPERWPDWERALDIRPTRVPVWFPESIVESAHPGLRHYWLHSTPGLPTIERIPLPKRCVRVRVPLYPVYPGLALALALFVWCCPRCRLGYIWTRNSLGAHRVYITGSANAPIREPPRGARKACRSRQIGAACRDSSTFLLEGEVPTVLYSDIGNTFASF